MSSKPFDPVFDFAARQFEEGRAQNLKAKEGSLVTAGPLSGLLVRGTPTAPQQVYVITERGNIPVTYDQGTRTVLPIKETDQG